MPQKSIKIPRKDRWKSLEIIPKKPRHCFDFKSLKRIPTSIHKIPQKSWKILDTIPGNPSRKFPNNPSMKSVKKILLIWDKKSQRIAQKTILENSFKPFNYSSPHGKGPQKESHMKKMILKNPDRRFHSLFSPFWGGLRSNDPEKSRKTVS